MKLVEALYENNILRGISTIKHTNHDLKITITEDGGSAQWVEESHAYPDSDLTFGQITLKAYKLGTKILVSDELLEESGIDLEAYIKKCFGENIGRAEEEAFLTGDGIGKPTGLIYQAQPGTETAEAGKVCIDDVIDLVHSLKQPYRHGKNTAFIMSEKVYQMLRKTRTASGRLIWSSNTKADDYDTLFGYRVYVSKYLDSTEPGFALGTYPILFGDFSFFWIGDRGKRVIKRLAERYADYGQVGFVVTQRVDGKLVRPEAIKVRK
ncbi:MAG: phage major capsid protein [Eubacteriales bacterium]|jgi:HK97 family phage major capsid protein